MTLEDCRAEMAAIDNELLHLLNRRARLATRLGALDSVAGLHPAEEALERDSLDRACRANAGPLDEYSVAKIFRRIIHETQHADERTAAAHSSIVSQWWHAAAAVETTHEEVGELV